MTFVRIKTTWHAHITIRVHLINNKCPKYDKKPFFYYKYSFIFCKPNTIQLLLISEGHYVFGFKGALIIMIGEQLRTLRTANKMTQKELAGELSVAFQTISNWENNSIDPSVSMILRIAEYFNCSTDYLLKG